MTDEGPQPPLHLGGTSVTDTWSARLRAVTTTPWTSGSSRRLLSTDLHRGGEPVLAVQREPDRAVHAGPVEHVEPERPVRPGELRLEEAEEVGVEVVGGLGDAEERDRRADVADGAVGVEDGNGVGHVLQQSAEPAAVGGLLDQQVDPAQHRSAPWSSRREGRTTPATRHGGAGPPGGAPIRSSRPRRTPMPPGRDRSGADHHVRLAAPHLVERPPGDRLGGRVDVVDAPDAVAVGPEQHHRVREAVDERRFDRGSVRVVVCFGIVMARPCVCPWTAPWRWSNPSAEPRRI